MPLAIKLHTFVVSSIMASQFDVPLEKDVCLAVPLVLFAHCALYVKGLTN